ncbi:hypothetical protein COCNU_05G003290 [Cocos nucifera]|uniref:Uncharacterized protein n=1 Tax=Cocos nucifera TaxID=13894 RepID=A0A8K0N1A9_COCNU|nr:hypothetical protein COCNU_05G003290 [Cocos nucifera]
MAQDVQMHSLLHGPEGEMHRPGLILKKKRYLVRRKGNIDCLSKLVCSGSMGGSKLKHRNVTPPRRQSLRLQGISAIYEAKGANMVNLNSKHQQQISGDYSTGANQVKVEMLETKEGSYTSKSKECVNNPADSSYPENCNYEETNNAGGDQSLIDLTLKDLQASCKAKKRKVRKSGASAAVNLNSCSHFDPSRNWKDDYMKPKEEEFDLEEPIITLKFKVSKGSTADRKQRKRARLSPVSLVPMEVVTAKTCSVPSNDMQTSMLVAEMKASITNKPSKDSASEQHDLTSEAETVEGDFGRSVKENFVEANNSLLSSTTYGDNPELVYVVKTEIGEPCFLNEQNAVNIDTNSTLDIISTCNFLDNSSAELLQKVGLNYCFPSSVPDLERILHVGSPELADTVKSEISENGSPLHENTIYIAASSTVDFIAKFNNSVKPSAGIFGRVEDVLEKQGSNSTSNTSTYCCLNEVSTEYMGPDQYCLPESDGKHAVEIGKMILSEMSNQKLCPSSVSVPKAVPCNPCSSAPVSVTLYPGSDICVSTEDHCILLEDVTHTSISNQMQCSSSSNSSRGMDFKLAEACASVLGREDAQSLTHDLPVQEMPIRAHMEDVTNDPSLLSKEHDLSEVFNTGTEGECLNNSAHHTVAADELKNSNESARTDIEEFSTTEAYKLYSTESSYTCCGADLHALAKTSHKAELSSKVEGHTEEATSDSVEICGLIDPEELNGEPDLGSPKPSLPCSSSLSGLHYADSLSKDAGECSSFVVEEKLHATKDESSSEISQLIDEKGQNMEKEDKHDQGMLVDNPPKKLLSNRKTISPTSQEKLCQALNDIDLCDASQLSSHMEAETLLAPERMRAKPKNCDISSLLSVKGILRSPDAYCKTPCSCMKSSSFHQQAEKAIEFSQRQMHDIENIAMKLLKGLKSMKNIVEETLSLESCSLPSKFTVDEIRAAAENASELERTTRRWLSMMTKDCNRFCKIMRLSENKEATPPKDVSKKRKRITFADEAGGVLCQVKVFKQQPAAVVVPESDEADVSHVLL